jgi:hypothetical protein
MWESTKGGKKGPVEPYEMRKIEESRGKLRKIKDNRGRSGHRPSAENAQQIQ